MHLNRLYTTLALVAVASAELTTGGLTTVTIPGVTQTIPVGVEKSSTLIVPGHTVTGSAVYISSVTVIEDANTVVIIGSNGNLVAGGRQATNIAGGITVIDGVVQGASGGATATDNSGAANTASSAATSTTTTGAAARAFGGANVVAWAGGVGAIVAAAVNL